MNHIYRKIVYLKGNVVILDQFESSPRSEQVVLSNFEYRDLPINIKIIAYKIPYGFLFLDSIG